MARKRIILNAFHMNCVVHHSAGLWPHPQDKSNQYTDLNTWVELAQLLNTCVRKLAPSLARVGKAGTLEEVFGR